MSLRIMFPNLRTKLSDLSKVLTIPLVLGIAVPSAHADKWFVVAVNHCSEVSAGEPARMMRDALSRQIASDVMPEEETARALGGSAVGSLDEAERLFSAARIDFVGGEFDRAAREAVSTRELLMRLKPSPDRWKTFRDASVTLAWVKLRQNDHDAAFSAMRELLTVDPTYEPPKSLYSDSPRVLAKEVRASLKKAPHSELTIKTDPPNMPVYIGMRPLPAGTTKVTLADGDYVIEGGFAGARGLPRRIHVEGPTQVSLSAAFEGAVWPDHGPCIAAGTDRSERLKFMTQIASVTRAQKAVAMELEEPAAGERYIVASVVDATTGQEIRIAKVQLGPSINQSVAVEQLASFVLTGRAPDTVQVVTSRPSPPIATKRPAPAPETKPKESARATTPPLVIVQNDRPLAPSAAKPEAAAPAALETTQSAPGSSPSGLRVASYVAGGVGVVAIGFGIFELAQKSSADSDFDKYYQQAVAGDYSAAPKAADALHRSDNARTLSTIGLAAGGAAVATGVVLFLVSRPDDSVHATAALVDGKPGLVVAGKF